MKQESEFFIFFKKEFSNFSHIKRKSVLGWIFIHSHNLLTVPYNIYKLREPIIYIFNQDFTLLQYNSFTIYFKTFPGNFKFYNVPFLQTRFATFLAYISQYNSPHNNSITLTAQESLDFSVSWQGE